jgi:hypothetical protein
MIGIAWFRPRKGYANEHKENRWAAPVNYHEVSVRFAQIIIELASGDLESATEAMAQEIHNEKSAWWIISLELSF